MDTMGVRIKFMRERKGWTQERLSGVVGIKRASLGNYETGRTRPTTKILKKIAIALDTQPVNLDPDLEPNFNAEASIASQKNALPPGLREIDVLIMKKLATLPESDASKVYTYICDLEEKRKTYAAHERSTSFRRIRAAEERADYQAGAQEDPEPPSGN